MADKRINIKFDASMDVSKLKSSVAEISKSLQGVTLPTTLGNNFKTTLSNLEREIANFEKRSADGLRSASDFSQLKKSGDSIISLYEKLVKSATDLGNLSDKQLTNLMPKATVDNIKKASAAMETFKATIDKTAKSINSQTQKVEAQKKVIDQLKSDLAATKGQKTVSTDEYKQMQLDIAAAAQEVKNYEQQQTQLNQSLTQMEQTLKAPSKSSRYRTLKNDLDACSQSLEQTKAKQEQLQEAFNNTTTVTANARDIRKLAQDIADETTKLQGLESELQNLQSQGNTSVVTQLKTDLQDIQGLDLTQCGDDVQKIETAVNGFQAAQIQQVKNNLIPIINATQSGAGSVKNFAQQFKNLSNDFSTFIDRSREFDMLQSRIQHFFGITNSIMLFRRAINSAVDTIKELDKAMTEMAVVTDLGVSDYWDQLPTYTKRANELGLAIKDVYESMTLFYQQGLNTAQATALSNATLKMARIAGLDAAEATDRMTNALRGFRMELNEDSATNVADVYSALAARTASDVDEISVAMTKVASIADSAGMSFENTAAFLSQIIETTRESAETAGTALKTVIARFSEVKKLRSEGLSTGTDEEGESIDVNKVDAALKTVGISMKNFFEGAEGLDSIFIQLTNKWDTLDTYTQRYIATQAAGSRQQSRFIALMSDAARQQELVALANNAAGASAEQYAKTLESLETKLNKLKNAWDQFTMGIANEKVVKFGVDALTGLVNIINNCTEALGDFWGALAKLGLSFGALKAGKVLFSSLFAALKNQAAETGLSAGKVFGQTFSAGMKTSFTGVRKLFSKNFWVAPKMDFSASKQAVQELNKAFQSTIDASQALAAVNKQADREMKTQGLIAEATYDAQTNAVLNLAKAEAIRNELLQSLGITTEQYNAVLALGLSEEEMAIALSDKEIFTKVAEIAATEGLSDAEKKEQIQQILNNKANQAGILIRIKSLLLKAKETLATWLKNLADKAETKGILGKFAANKLLAASQKSVLTLTLAIVAAIGLLVAAVIGIIALIKKLISLTPENQFKAASEAAKDAADAANQAAEAYNDLTESLSALKDEYNGLEALAVGTREWKDAVRDVNNEVLDLIEKYPELASLVENKNGVLTLDIDSAEVQDVIDKYENIMTQADSASNAAEIKKQQKGLTLEYAKLDYDAKAYHDVGNGTLVANRADTEQLARALVNGDVSNYEGVTLEEQLQNYADANNILINVTDDTVAALQKFGNTLATTDAVIDTYYTDMANNAYNAAELVGTEENRARAAIYATNDLMKSLTEKQQAELGTSKSDKKSLANEYAQQILGLSVSDYDVKDNGNIVYTDETGEKKTVKAEDIRTQMAGVKATEQMTENIEQFNGVIAKASDNFTKHLYDAAEGAKLTAKDLEAIGVDFEHLDLENLSDADAQTIKDYYQGLTYTDENGKVKQIFDDATIEELYGGWDEFIQYVAESGQIAANTFASIKGNFAQMGVDSDIFTDFELSAGALNNIGDAIGAAFEVSGKSGAQQMAQYLNSVLNSIDDDATREAFTDLLHSVDWHDIDSIEKFNDELANLDVNWDKVGKTEEEFKAEMIRLGKATKTVDLETLTEQIKNLSNIALNIKKGDIDRSFSDDEYKTLTENGLATATDFVYNLETGNYDYIGESTDAIVTAIEQQTSDLLNGSDLAANVASGEAALALKESGTLEAADREDINSLYQYLTAYNEQIGGDDQNMLFTQELIDLYQSTNNTAALQAIFDQIMGNMINLSANKDSLTQAENANKQTAYQTLDYSNNSAGVQAAINAGDTAEVQNYSSALLAQAIAAGVDKEALDKFTQAIQNGTDAEKIAATVALQSQIANLKLNDGLREITDSYDTWTTLIDKESGLIKASTSDEIKAFNDLKKSVNKMLNTSEDLSDEFWQNAENIDLVKKAAEGSVDAIEDLQKAAAADFLGHMTLNVDTEQAHTAVQDFIDYLNTVDIPKLEAGVQWNGEGADQFIEAFNQMAKTANFDAAQIQAAAQSMGFSAEVTYVKQFRKIPKTTTIETITPLTSRTNKITTKSYADGYDWVYSEFPVVKTLTSNGTGGGGISVNTVDAGQKNAGGGSSGGGSSKEDEPEWENPYDRMYETLQDINAELRERERLEKRYQILCKRGENTQEKTRQYYEDLNKHYEQEYTLQQKMADSKAGEINYLMSTYSDVARYARYDAASGTIDMDWEAVQQLDIANNEEVGKRLEEFVSKLEDAQDAREEAIDAQYDIINEIEDIKQSMRDTYFNLEERVADALKQIDEDLVDEQEKINDALDEAADNLVDAIRDNVNATRQLRDNQNSEEEIAKKERRLAYLRQDTSGANKLEIIQLEQELDDMKLSYQDTIVDQALNKLQTQNDKAAEQRDLQIELARAQIEWNEKNAVYVDQFRGLLETALAPDGTLDMESKLIKTLEQGENWNGLSREQQTETLKNLTNDIITVISALENNLLDNNLSNDGIGGNLNDITTSDIGKVTPITPSSSSSSSTSTSGGASATTDQIKGVAAAIWGAGSLTSGWGTGSTRRARLTEKMGSSAASQVQSLINRAEAGDATLYNYWANTLGKKASQFYYGAFKTGGLADFTGPAWLDGTKAKPEMVLNATDTQNLIQLKDILGDILRTGMNNNGNSGDYSFDIDINVDEIGNDYDVNRLAAQVKQELVDAMTYRNNNSVSYLR